MPPRKRKQADAAGAAVIPDSTAAPKRGRKGKEPVSSSEPDKEAPPAIIRQPSRQLSRQLSGDAGASVVTGASRGLGLGFCAELLQRGKRVVAGFLPSDGDSELRALVRRYGGAIWVRQLDVTDSTSVEAFATWFKNTCAENGIEPRISLLINNAGVYFDKSTSLAQVDVANISRMLAVNAVGPLQVTRALLPYLKGYSGRPPVVAGISSRQGSLAMVRGAMKIYAKSYGYKMSKAAQNCFTLTLSVDHPHICAVAIHPGFVRTDMTKHKASLSVEESTRSVLDRIAELSLADTGTFFDVKGTKQAW